MTETVEKQLVRLKCIFATGSRNMQDPNVSGYPEHPNYPIFRSGEENMQLINNLTDATISHQLVDLHALTQ